MKANKQKLIWWRMTLLTVILSAGGAVFAHEAHNKPAATGNTNAATAAETKPAGQPESPLQPGTQNEAAPHLTEFPTLHPLVVHFPIMLIMIAAVIQIVSLFLFRRELSWVVIFMTAFGALGAYLSSSVFHPHTTGLNENAQRLLTEHELYADWTLWLSLLGLAAKLVSNFILNRRWWSETFVTVALIAAGVAVALAGHHGAELVHKEGVGPRGQFLEMHDH